LPDTHALQLLAVVTEYMPAAQSSQLLSAAAFDFPARQLLHIVAPVLTGSTAQHAVVHPVQPAGLKQQALTALTDTLHAASASQTALLVWSPQQSQHGWLWFAVLGVAVNFPALQSVQVLACAPENLPDVQMLQPVAPELTAC
jgi:hypothetical protein